MSFLTDTWRQLEGNAGCGRYALLLVATDRRGPVRAREGARPRRAGRRAARRRPVDARSDLAEDPIVTSRGRLGPRQEAASSSASSATSSRPPRRSRRRRSRTTRTRSSRRPATRSDDGKDASPAPEPPASSGGGSAPAPAPAPVDPGHPAGAQAEAQDLPAVLAQGPVQPAATRPRPGSLTRRSALPSEEEPAAGVPGPARRMRRPRSSCSTRRSRPSGDGACHPSPGELRDGPRSEEGATPNAFDVHGADGERRRAVRARPAGDQQEADDGRRRRPPGSSKLDPTSPPRLAASASAAASARSAAPRLLPHPLSARAPGGLS